MYKIKDAYYDKEDGMATVIISTDLGCFEGYAFLNPEDKDIESSFIGCEVAEYRAAIQYLKMARYRLNICLQGLYKARTMMKRANQDYSVLQELIAKYEMKSMEHKQDIKDIYKAIDTKLDTRIEFLNKIAKKKEKDSE